MGNLKSVSKLLHHLHINFLITSNAEEIYNSHGIILPGVGAFGDAMSNLRSKGLDLILKSAIREEIPFLGICLGLHMLFSVGYEMGSYDGLDIIKGEVIKFDKKNVGKIPQIGWNSVKFTDNSHFLVKGIPNDSYFYFVHSYYPIAENNDTVLGITTYGKTEYCSVITKNNVVATQFHLEKSGHLGILMMKNFLNQC